jgi:hypothetical protein
MGKIIHVFKVNRKELLIFQLPDADRAIFAAWAKRIRIPRFMREIAPS